MSRTRKGSKSPGYEYWSKRCPKRWGMDPGKFSKTQTHRHERRNGKKETKPDTGET